MLTPNLAVIILNWNGLKDTLECLETIVNSHTPNFHLIIYLVDNGSTDGSPQAFVTKYPHVHLITSPRNLGYSGGNNLGIREALADGADFIVLLNNDTTVTSDTFSILLEQSIKHQFDLASPKIYFYPGREFHLHQYHKHERGRIIWFAGGRIDWDNVLVHHLGVNEYDHGQYDQVGSTEFATGCCLLIKRHVFEKIGFLDPVYKAYFEDNDLCQRALRKGLKLGYVGNTHMWHKNASASGGSGSPAQTKLVDRSRLIFGLRYAPFRAKLALIKFYFGKINLNFFKHLS